MRLSAAASVAPSLIREVALLADSRPGTLRLFYGEDTLPTPDFIKDAAKHALDENHTYYTPNAGNASMREAISDRIRLLHRVEVDPSSEVVVTASGMVALQLACQAVLGPGDSALVLTPLWPNISAAIRVVGAEAIEVPLTLIEDQDGCRYVPEIEKLEEAVRPNTRLLALASPGNPTAWTATLDDWRRLLDFREKHGLWLLADGVYERIYRDADVAPSPLSIPEARAKTIVAQSFSKSYRMTGWRLGYAVAPAEVALVMSRLQEFVVSHAFGVAQEAGRVALRDGEPFVKESRARYLEHARLAVTALEALPGVTVPDPSGAFYLFPRLDGLTDSFAFCRDLVERHGVGFAPGRAFGAGGEGHIRICHAVDREVLVEALRRFAVAWSEFRGS